MEKPSVVRRRARPAIPTLEPGEDAESPTTSERTGSCQKAIFHPSWVNVAGPWRRLCAGVDIRFPGEFLRRKGGKAIAPVGPVGVRTSAQ